MDAELQDIAARATEEALKLRRSQDPPPDINIESSESATSSLSGSSTREVCQKTRQIDARESKVPPSVDNAVATASSAFIGCTTTHLRGLGLGSEVDRDELNRGDAICLVPEPLNPFDRKAVKGVTSDGRYIGNINKHHAKAGFSQMLRTVASRKIKHRANIKSFIPLPTWDGKRDETAKVEIELSFFGSGSKVPSLHRLMKEHELPFHHSSVDALTPTPAGGGV